MKQTTASYQFELSEQEITLVCTAVSCAISDTRESYEYLKDRIKNGKASKDEILDLTKEFLCREKELRSLLDLYNGFGRSVGKLKSISL